MVAKHASEVKEETCVERDARQDTPARARKGYPGHREGSPRAAGQSVLHPRNARLVSSLLRSYAWKGKEKNRELR